MGAEAERAGEGRTFKDEALSAKPDDVATIIYTSGTTGDPKGVMLTHDNIRSNVMGTLQVLHIGPEDSCLSFLPLSHIFERMAGHYTMFHAGHDDPLRGEHRHRPAEPGGRRPDDRPLGAAALREDVRARAGERAGGRRAEEADLLLGARGRRPLGRPPARGRDRAGAPGVPVPDRPAPRLLQAQGADRRPDQVLLFRRRAAPGGHRQVLLRGRPPDPRGVRAHRDLAGDVREPPRAAAHRHRRAGRSPASR